MTAETTQNPPPLLYNVRFHRPLKLLPSTKNKIKLAMKLNRELNESIAPNDTTQEIIFDEDKYRSMEIIEKSHRRSDLTIMSQNLRSAAKNLDRFEYLSRQAHADIILFHEIWQVPPKISGFQDFSTLRTKKRGGGLSTLVADRLQSSFV